VRATVAISSRATSTSRRTTIYLPPTMEVAAPAVEPPRSRYAHRHWPLAYDLIRDVWSASPVAWEAAVVTDLERWIEDVEAGAALPEPRRPTADPARGRLAPARRGGAARRPATCR
jgi:hypothetical protein